MTGRMTSSKPFFDDHHVEFFIEDSHGNRTKVHVPYEVLDASQVVLRKGIQLEVLGVVLNDVLLAAGLHRVLS
jgi:hypothetical protein